MLLNRNGRVFFSFCPALPGCPGNRHAQSDFGSRLETDPQAAPPRWGSAKPPVNARRFGLSVEIIQQANGLADPHKLLLGQVLLIP
ncbi:MAG: LysM domain-containing protein [Acidobacteria bacterium]|nr:MAG: LysM domain-containing protein [Acidobacteriota bacterium]